MHSPFRNTVAAIQMNSGMNVSDNLQQASVLLEQAAKQGAALAVLPEMFPLIGQGPGLKAARIRIQEQEGNGPIQDFISALAKRLKIWIIAGTIPIASEDPTRSYAACLVFNEDGKQVARYDKLHLFDAALDTGEVYRESDSTFPGNKIVLVHTPVGKIGLGVCYDLRFPELFRQLQHMGAEIFAVPAAFTVTTGKLHWETLTRAIAIHNFCYVIGAGQHGLHGMGRETYGNSIIISPNGEVLSQLENGIGVLTAQIDLNWLAAKRKEIPAFSHQRIFPDTDLQKVIASPPW